MKPQFSPQRIRVVHVWTLARAVITFNPLLTGGRVAFDNLTVNAIPEPATLLLLGSGLAGLAQLARRRKQTK